MEKWAGSKSLFGREGIVTNVCYRESMIPRKSHQPNNRSFRLMRHSLVLFALACFGWFAVDWRRRASLEVALENSIWREHLPVARQVVAAPPTEKLWIGVGGKLSETLAVRAEGDEVRIDGTGTLIGPVAVRTDTSTLYFTGKWLVHGPVSVHLEQGVWRQQEGRVLGCSLTLTSAVTANREFEDAGACGIFTEEQMRRDTTELWKTRSLSYSTPQARACVFWSRFPGGVLKSQPLDEVHFPSLPEPPEQTCRKNDKQCLRRQWVPPLELCDKTFDKRCPGQWSFETRIGWLGVQEDYLRRGHIAGFRIPHDELTKAACWHALLELDVWRVEYEEPFLYLHERGRGAESKGRKRIVQFRRVG